MDLVEWVRQNRGIAHRRQLAATGFSRYRLELGLRSGRLRPAGRFWIAHAVADPRLVLAATIGGRLACVSAAREHGLWVLADDPCTHIAVPPRSMAASREGVRFHRSIPLAPARRTDLVEPILDVLAHVATCLDREQALVIWESALRQGRIHPAAVAGVDWRSRAAQELAASAGALSDSGLETLVVDRLRGIGLPLAQQALLLGHKVDILVGDCLVIQLDGWEFHSSAADRARDNRHDARLRAAGYRVIRIGYAEVVAGWAAIEAEIALAVAQGAHLVRRSAASAWTRPRSTTA